MNNPRIDEALDKAFKQLEKHSDSAMLDAEVLLSFCLNKPRSYLKAWPEHTLNQEHLRQFEQLLALRQQQTPVAYLTGQREFWSRDFSVTPDVLIPRPDTELLIEISLEILKDKNNPKILDLGTGSGIIAVTLALEIPQATVTATDISHQALKIAQDNARKHNARVHFIQSDWLENIADTDFELIISNPPYIAANDPHLYHSDLEHEPVNALVSEDNGLNDLKKIARQARHHLKEGGQLLLEHGYNQQSEVKEILTASQYSAVKTYTDLSGHPRATIGQWNP